MNDKLKAGDAITGEATIDERTAAVMNRLRATANMIGPNIMQTLPSNQRMLEVVCHALARNKVAPEYESMLSNVAMMMTVGEMLRADLIAKGVTPHAHVLPMSGDSPAESIRKSMTGEIDASDTIVAKGVSCGIAEGENGSSIIINMTVELDGVDRIVMGGISPADARGIGAGLIKSAEVLEAGVAPAKGIH